MSFLSMTRGDGRVITAGPVQNPPANFGSCSFYFTAKYSRLDPDSAAVIQKLPGAWTINAPAFTAQCVIAPADLAALPFYTVLLRWDIQLKDTSGNIYTIDSGFLRIIADVTRTTA